MKSRSLFVTVLLLLAMVFGASQAQDIDPCFGLSADDCTALTDANTNLETFMDGVGSFTIDINVSFAATDIPDESMSAASYSQVGYVNIIENEESEVGINAYGTFDIAFNDGSADTALTVEFYIVDDMLYFLDPTDETLYSMDLVRVMEEGDFNFDFEAASEDPEAAMENLPVDAEQLELLTALIELPGLLNHVRDGDSFVFTLDLGVLAAPENQETINEIVAAITEEDPATGAQIQSYIGLLPMLLDTGVINFSQNLNSELGIIDSYAMEANFVVSTGMMMGDPQLPATTVDFAFDFTLGNFDGVEAISAPEGEAIDLTDTAIESMSGAMPSGE